MDQARAPFGDLLRRWRQRRGLTQLMLAGDAEVSARHLSWLETGRSAPSRAMVLRLAQRLDLPLRDRNAWLVAAGFAPAYREQPLDGADQADLRATLQRLLDAHGHHPALAVDRHWQLIAANRALNLLLHDVDAALMLPPVNVLRVALHPLGMAKSIVNLGAWRAHVLQRLARQAFASGDPVLHALQDELAAYPAPPPDPPFYQDLPALPLQLNSPVGPLSFLSAVTVFGAPHDVTLAELAVETFLAADEITAERMRDWLSL